MGRNQNFLLLCKYPKYFYVTDEMKQQVSTATQTNEYSEKITVNVIN